MSAVDILAVCLLIDAILLQYLVTIFHVSFMVADAARSARAWLAESFLVVLPIILPPLCSDFLALSEVSLAVVLSLFFSCHCFMYLSTSIPNVR